MPKTIYVLKDCKWGTYRGVFWTKKEATENIFYNYCKIIKFTEVVEKKTNKKEMGK